MTRTELLTLATTFNGGIAPDDSSFTLLLNVAKNKRESARDWMVLRTQDSSNVLTASDTYLTLKNLPDRFVRVIYKDNDDTGVALVDANGSRMPLLPIPLSKRFQFKDVEGYYYIDVKNGGIGRTGTRAGTLYIDYLENSEDLDDDDTIEWTFPEYAHPLLAADVIQQTKGIIDWDRVNASQIPYTRDFIMTIESTLAHWDAQLQQAELGV